MMAVLGSEEQARSQSVHEFLSLPKMIYISLIWIGIGFGIYRLFTFRSEIEHYAPIVTSEGDIT